MKTTPTSREVERPAPAIHSAQIRQELSEMVAHLDADRERCDDPKFAAPLATSATVLRGLSNLYVEYDEQRARDTHLRE